MTCNWSILFSDTAKILIGAALFSFLSVVVAVAEKKEVKDEAAWVVPTHIQLNPIMVPVTGRRAAPVTLYIEASNKEYVGNICDNVPRLLDAIFKVLTRDPVPVLRRRLILGDVPGQLLLPMNEAIGNNPSGIKQIKEIFVVAGAVRMGGGSITRLPFARINGCRSIRQAEAERMKAEAAKKDQ
jgi:hypothetical protein